MDARWTEDPEFEAHVVDRAEPSGEGWMLQFDDGWCIHCPGGQELVAPQHGEQARLYGRGLGFAVRGIVIEGRVYRYQTDEEHEAARVREREERLAQERREWTDGQEKYTADVAALPDPLRRRIERFLLRDGWGPEFGRYELFVCQEAAKIAAACGTADKVREFGKATVEAQHVMVPTISDEHSGNTHGAAVRLAFLYLTDPDLVPNEHGALCPLVGCRKYGCWAASQDEA